MDSLKHVALVAALALGLGTTALAQSNSGITNAAPNPGSSFQPKAGSSTSTGTRSGSPAGISNGAPNAGNANFPKDKRKHRSGKHIGTNAPGGITNAAPDAKVKPKALKKASNESPKPAMPN